MLQFDMHIVVRHFLPNLFTVKYGPVFWPTLLLSFQTGNMI